MQGEYKFSTKVFFEKCKQICNFLRISFHWLKNPLMENFSFLCSEYCMMIFIFSIWEKFNDQIITTFIVLDSARNG